MLNITANQVKIENSNLENGEVILKFMPNQSSYFLDLSLDGTTYITPEGGEIGVLTVVY